MSSSSQFTSPPEPHYFNTQVWEVVRQIPCGRVTTYGRIGSWISIPDGMDAQSYSRLAPRWVGSAMRNCPPGLPWHRVLNSQGKISLPFEHGGSLQRQLLEAEGIVFDLHDRIDLNEFGWEGPVK